MAVSQELMYAILAMDSYNRGYLPGISLEGTSIGTANITPREVFTNEVEFAEWQAAGFYAVAYDTEYGTVISYRGTDNPDLLLSGEGGSGSDIWEGWLTGVGFLGSQAYLAADFYQAVTGTSESDPRTGAATLTGHSLGGGLAGLVGALYHQNATVFDNMPFELAASNAYTEATRLFPSQMVVEQLYNNLTPWEQLIGGNLEAYAVTGEILTPGRNEQATPVTSLDSHGGFRLPTELHSQALLVTLLYAEEQGFTDWIAIVDPLWDAAFSEDVAVKAGFQTKGNGGSSTAAGKMLSAIAYSAIDGNDGLVFGNTGIRALFDDANELGKLVDEGKVPTAHANPIPGLAEAIVQFAGQMALGKVNYNQHMDWNPQTGFLSTYDSQGVTYLKADLAPELWTLNDPGGENNPEQEVDIKGITTILNEFFAQEEEAALILAAMNTLYGSNATTTIDRIDFALGSGSLTVALQERGDDEESGGNPPPYNPEKTSLFVALDGDDEVDGNSDNNMLVGGAGDDRLYGRLGSDIILGGTGSDRIIDLVHEVGTDGRSNESDIYFGEPSDQSLLAHFFAWLLGTQSEDTVEYRLTDERQPSTPPAQGLEITTLDVTENFDEEVVALGIQDLNTGKTATDYLVNIDKVVLSERGDKVVVNPAWLEVPLWIDLGEATENRMAA